MSSGGARGVSVLARLPLVDLIKSICHDSMRLMNFMQAHLNSTRTGFPDRQPKARFHNRVGFTARRPERMQGRAAPGRDARPGAHR